MVSADSHEYETRLQAHHAIKIKPQSDPPAPPEPPDSDDDTDE